MLVLYSAYILRLKQLLYNIFLDSFFIMKHYFCLRLCDFILIFHMTETLKAGFPNVSPNAIFICNIYYLWYGKTHG